MTGIQAVGVLVIRLWAAVNIINSLAQLAFITIIWFQKFDQIESDYRPSVSDFFFLVWLAAGFVAWFMVPRVVKWLLPAHRDGEGVTLSIDAQDLVRLGSFLIGAFFLIDVGPTLIGHLINAVAHSGVDELGRSKMRYFDIGNIVADTVKFVIALALMVSPRGLANLFSKLRTAGLGPID